MEGYDRESSFKHKLRYSLCCCFPLDDYERPNNNKSSVITTSSSSSSLSQFKELFSRIGKAASRRGRRSNSADFKYDPLSYALNFDQGSQEFYYNDDDFPLRNFASRLPASPLPADANLSSYIS
ncbi:hypothetical protein FRX31_027218 [Thalictrum thalictroides]|uniref:Uncharacterized protein n=1 Tax=Thalictrum thalictroides TaxID=46969 RepID=A0A7J6VG50_THATH|nr:hypothetical protein FRX31_027218 [Thalictrum thalictroides]